MLIFMLLYSKLQYKTSNVTWIAQFLNGQQYFLSACYQFNAYNLTLESIDVLLLYVEIDMPMKFLLQLFSLSIIFSRNNC